MHRFDTNGTFADGEIDFEVRNCTFVDNDAEFVGGAIFLFDSDAVFRDCTFARNGSLDGRGGAIGSNGSKQVRYERCTFVDNACKYAQTDGASVIELTCRAEEGHVVIAVRDHGPGVPARQERSLFVAFDRGEHGESDQPGIGLGLAASSFGGLQSGILLDLCHRPTILRLLGCGLLRLSFALLLVSLELLDIVHSVALVELVDDVLKL